MSRESDIATEHAIALSDMGKNTGRRLYPTHDEIAQLAFSLFESRGRQEGHQVESYGTTLNCEVATKHTTH